MKKTSKENHIDGTPTIKTESDVGSSCSTPRKTTEVPETKQQEATEESKVDTEEVGTPEMNSKKVKTEDMEEIATSEQDNHLHRFTVKFGSDSQKYTIDCTKPRTVLQAIQLLYKEQLKNEMEKSQTRFNDNIKKRTVKTNEKIKVSEENIIIEVGEGNDFSIVATHFPCCLVEENQCLTITITDTAVKKRREELRVLPKENYSVFFIDKELGEGDKYKRDMVFTCKNIPANCKYFCVYGIKSCEGKTETVVEALRRDGRFVDDLTDFYLSDNETRDLRKHTGVVDNLDGIKFKMCNLPPKKKLKKQDPTQQTNHEEQEAKVSAPTSGQIKSETTSVLELAAEKRVSIKTAMEELGYENINHEEIIDLLRKQFPKLKEWMEMRFPGPSFDKTLKLKKENFGKIQNSFSKVHTVRELLKLSKSICLLMIEENNNSGLTDLKKTVKGTGFVLFDNFVLTNAHLFKPWENLNDWSNNVNITAEFNFENEPGIKYQAALVCRTHDLDFALLELIQIPDRQELKEKPPGLLKIFDQMPGGDGGACIIGHPAGGVKKMDITCIITNKDREQKVKETLASFKPFIVCSTIHQIKRDPYSDIRVTYNSFMYHGSSGSPVFDAFGRVFGLHSGGFLFNKVIPGHSVMEFCYPVLDVFRKLLEELQKAGREDLLKRIQEEAEGNMYLNGILESVGLKQTKDQTLCGESENR